MVREYNDLLGNPEIILRSQDEVDKMRQAQQQEMAAQKGLATAHGAMQTLDVGADAASTLANIPMNAGGGAVAQLLSGGIGA